LTHSSTRTLAAGGSTLLFSFVRAIAKEAVSTSAANEERWSFDASIHGFLP
jgi:hypothetical protein